MDWRCEINDHTCCDQWFYQIARSSLKSGGGGELPSTQTARDHLFRTHLTQFGQVWAHFPATLAFLKKLLDVGARFGMAVTTAVQTAITRAVGNGMRLKCRCTKLQRNRCSRNARISIQQLYNNYTTTIQQLYNNSIQQFISLQFCRKSSSPRGLE